MDFYNPGFFLSRFTDRQYQLSIDCFTFIFMLTEQVFSLTIFYIPADNCFYASRLLDNDRFGLSAFRFIPRNYLFLILKAQCFSISVWLDSKDLCLKSAAWNSTVRFDLYLFLFRLVTAKRLSWTPAPLFSYLEE